ncbi:fumarylacetoacetate hydrolase family protein [Alteromonas sp. H39]|uniref:fumarylacetoacetate hydrolase family protein n=1 Tax=Alteromonas sp. H39 TaxID=3389876 RepID=UPI0039E00DC8
MYLHQDNLGNPIDLPVGKVVCVGRNYLDHIDEMRSAVPDEPLLFMKPKAALCDMSQPLVIPLDKGECQNELEVAVLLKHPLCKADQEEAIKAIWGVGLALDFTLRELQRDLKEKGLPWERCKSFDFSCPVSGFVPASQIADLQDLTFSLTVNGQQRQSGHTALMLHKVADLLSHMSQVFTLDAGDIIITGTPKGVEALKPGDELTAALDGHVSVSTTVAGK